MLQPFSALFGAMAIAVTFHATAAESNAPANPGPSERLDAVVVQAEMPGPGMWKVSKGNHSLWILGTHAPIPHNFKWRGKDVDAVIARSQEVLSSPTVSISTKQIGFFTALFLFPSAMDARKNPDGLVLKDIISPDLYARWIVLRDRYVDEYNTNDEDKDIERWRPMFAALHLYSKAIMKSGMNSSSPVWPYVRESAKKHGIKVTEVKLEPPIQNPRAALNEFKSSKLADLDCFAKTIERIETDLQAMRLRATAWARGNLEALKKLPVTDQRAICEAAIRDAPFAKTLGAQDIVQQIENLWLQSAEGALQRNVSTLAVLPMNELLSANGYLAKLKRRGYTVEEPDALVE